MTYGLGVGLLRLGSSEVIAFAVTLVAVGVPTVILTKRGLMSFLAYWTVLALTQNVLAGVLARGGDDVPLVATEAKTVALVVATLTLSPVLIRAAAPHRALVASGALLAVLMAARSLEPTLATLAYARNFLGPVMLFVLVAAASRDLDRAAIVSTFKWWVIGVTAWLAIGSTGELIVGRETWHAFFSFDALSSLSSLSAYTEFLGVRLPRVGGFMGEPITAGYMAIGVALAALIGWKVLKLFSARGAATLVVIDFGVSVAAGTKNSILILAVGVGVLVLGRWLARRPAMTLLVAWTGATAATIGYLVVIGGPSAVRGIFEPGVRFIPGDSVSIHMEGLVEGIRAGLGMPLGYGLGQGGNFVNNFSGSDDFIGSWERVLTGAESGLGVVAYQLGIVGAILYVALLVATATWAGWPGSILIGSWSAAALYTEALGGPLSAAAFMVPAALMARMAARCEPDAGPGSERRVEPRTTQ